MNAPSGPFQGVATPGTLRAQLEAQRRAYLADPYPDHAQRIADLNALGRWVEDERDAILAAIDADFGSRSHIETLFGEVLGVLSSIKYAKSRLRGWMRERRRSADPMTFPLARNRLFPQPLGVVGVISPWNFPLILSFNPLVSAFAAGNRAMVKTSENSRRFAELMIRTAPKYFPPEKLMFFDDDGSLGPAFSALPFDHLIFTGSTETGRRVMASAARNLTPVTLELGGKSPAVIAPDFPIRTAAERIVWAKLFNAGQVCLAVDYCFVPEGREDEFVAHAKRLVAERYPDLSGPDYTAINNDRHFARLTAMLDDAREKGARLVNLAEGQAVDASKRKFPPHVILSPTGEMRAMQEEIFGPILPLVVYRDRQEVVDFINARPRPLAFYPFTRDSGLSRFYIERVMSGGVAINDAIVQFAQTDLPFGGVGASGLGHYQGREGFDALSKLRPIFKQGPATPIQWLFQPPYGKRARWLIDLMIRLKR